MSGDGWQITLCFTSTHASRSSSVTGSIEKLCPMVFVIMVLTEDKNDWFNSRG